jgi:hypothetical protein
MVKTQRNFLRLRHAKAHDDGTLKNPLFLKIKTPRWRIGAAVVGGIVAFTAACIGATYIPVLQLQTVAVHGTITLSPEDIEHVVRNHIASARLPLCSRTNVYFTRLASLEDDVMTRFPLQSVTITRQGQMLDIALLEKVTTIALRTKEKTVMLDVTGAYVRDATAEESRAIDIRIGSATPAPDELIITLQPDMPIIMNAHNDSITALSASSTAVFIALAQQLPINGMHATAFYIDGLDAPFVRIDTTEGYDLYVDIGLRTVEEQMKALHTIVTAEGFVPPSKYIDLRFGAYVYMK